VKNQQKVNEKKKIFYIKIEFSFFFYLEFVEQLLRQNQNRRLSRDDSTLDFLLYIFDAIDLLRLTNV